MSGASEHRGEELLGAHLDGRLTADELREFTDLVATDAELRRAFARALVLDEAIPRALPRRRLRLWGWTATGLAAAAALVLGFAWYRTPAPGPELIGSGVVVRHGVELPGADAGPLRAADTVRATGAVSLRWSDEGTTMELAAGGSLTLVAAGPVKDLSLTAGRLAVSAGHQAAGAGLTVRTARLAVAVVGTRFAVAEDALASEVTVSEGQVALRAGAQQVPLSAGQTAVCGQTGTLAIGRTTAADPAPAMPLVRLDPAAWQAVNGRGWTGTLGQDGLVAAAIDATAERVAGPISTKGYGTLRPELRLRLDVELAHPATVGMFLICRTADGTGFLGTYSVRVALPAGRHQRSWVVADCAVETGVPLAQALGGQVAGVAIGAWTRPAGLVVHSATLGP